VPLLLVQKEVLVAEQGMVAPQFAVLAAAHIAAVGMAVVVAAVTAVACAELTLGRPAHWLHRH
jgi:hypothetical protein